MSRTINSIVLHCADTPNGKHFSVEDIDTWHVDRGWHRDDKIRQLFNPNLKAIGYHYVIYVDGSVHAGRSEDEIGAHVEGFNSHSLGICMVGKTAFTEAQWDSLKLLLEIKLADYKLSKDAVKGHYQFDSRKTCPDFDVPQFVAAGLIPETVHVLAGG